MGDRGLVGVTPAPGGGPVGAGGTRIPGGFARLNSADLFLCTLCELDCFSSEPG